MPVSKKAYYTQLPETQFCRTMSVTRLGITVEKTVAPWKTLKATMACCDRLKKWDRSYLPAGIYIPQSVEQQQKTNHKNPVNHYHLHNVISC